MIRINDHILDYTTEQLAQWLEELPEWRRKQALAFKHDAGRRQSILAYRLLCQALREAYGVTEPPTFLYGEHGKPYLPPSPQPIHFSLSHCRGAVACVVGDRPCGIDIESPRKISEPLVRYAMNDEEQAIILQSREPSRTFLRLWTQKEAVGKLLGTGIRDNVKDLLREASYNIETRETEQWVMSVAEFH